MTEASSESIIKPGDVVIDEITLRSYTGFTMNLKGIFQNFILYEDIFSNYMSGSITIIDSLNLAKNFPIIGAETLTISYKTPTVDGKMVRLVFRTYKISVLTETAQEAAQMVRIEFVSHHAIKSMQTKISKSYMNMSVSSMVSSIFDEYLAIENGENNGLLNAALDGAVNGAITGSLLGLPGAIWGAGIGATIGAVKEATDDDKIHLASVTETGASSTKFLKA